MTAFRGPGVRQIGTVGTTPKEHRLAIAGQYAEHAPGVPRSGLLMQGSPNVVTLTGDTGTLSYSVGPFPAVIGRTAAEGVYTPTNTGTTKVTTTAAPASGSRYDLIWVKQNDPEKSDTLNGTPDNSAIIGVTQGTSAATPTRPTSSIPAGALVIAEARIFSGTTSTAQSPNTVTQTYPITAAKGAPIPVRNQAERDALPTAAGMLSLQLDTNALAVYVNGAWAPVTAPKPFGHAGKVNGFQPVASGGTVVVVAAQILKGGMIFEAATNSLVVPLTGLYKVTGNYYVSGGSGGRAIGSIRKNGVENFADARFSKPSIDDFTGHATCTVQLQAGDKLQMIIDHTNSTFGSTGYNGSYFEVEYSGIG